MKKLVSLLLAAVMATAFPFAYVERASADMINGSAMPPVITLRTSGDGEGLPVPSETPDEANADPENGDQKDTSDKPSDNEKNEQNEKNEDSDSVRNNERPEDGSKTVTETLDTPETVDTPKEEIKKPSVETKDTPDFTETPDNVQIPDIPADDTDKATDSDTETDIDLPPDTDSDNNIETDSDKPKPPPEYPMGDVSGDGKVQANDALFVLRFSVGYNDFDIKFLKYGDMNGDGNVDSTDAILILRITVDVDTTTIRATRYIDKTAEQIEAERLAELERQKEAERQAELERQKEAERQAEIERQKEAERQAEIERQKEAERQAEIERQKEAERQAEIERQKEAERQAEIERQKEAERKDYSTVKYGLDISKWNGWVDFDAVKAQGFDFVIISAGYGREYYQKDYMFDSNYTRAKAAGLDVGVYWYSYAVSEYDARQEARACMNAIAGKKFEYPIYFDIEESWQFWNGMWFCSSLVEGFCSELEANGYFAGFYASVAFARDAIYQSTQLKYAYWAADWTGSVHYSNPYGVWQYEVGYLYGCPGTVDKNVAYVDYPEMMKDLHRNGY